MREYPDKYFELAICDPPYGLGEGNKKNKTRSCYTGWEGEKKWVNAKDYGGGEWDVKPENEYFLELYRISKNQIIWGANHFGDLPPSSCWLVWDKVNGKSDLSDCELAWTSFSSAVRLFRFMWSGMLQGSISDGSKAAGDKSRREKRIHPTQKPVALYKWLLKNYAKEGDKILDTHLGSGSSRIAAFDMGFDFTGYELDKDYFDAQEKRFRNHKAQLKLFAA